MTNTAVRDVTKNKYKLNTDKVVLLQWASFHSYPVLPLFQRHPRIPWVMSVVKGTDDRHAHQSPSLLELGTFKGYGFLGRGQG